MNHIITADLKITPETIQKARKWEKRRNYKYGENVGELVLAYLLEGNSDDCEIEKVEMNECPIIKN